MSEERILPGAFGIVHEGRRTPWVAIVATTLLAMLLISVGELDDLATVTVLLLLAVFALVNVAVLVLRKDPGEEGHFVAPSVFPVLGLAISVVLFVRRVTDEDRTVLWILLALLTLGVILWLANRIVSGPVREVDPARPD